MAVLLIFAFLGGVVTILSPCILPVLPVVLSGSVAGGKKRPWGIITGFVVGFTFFTLSLTALVNAFGVSPDRLRTVSVFVIFLFGLSLIIPQMQLLFERGIGSLASSVPQATGDGFRSGVLIGLSLGLIWTPCVGPILASVIGDFSYAGLRPGHRHPHACHHVRRSAAYRACAWPHAEYQ